MPSEPIEIKGLWLHTSPQEGPHRARLTVSVQTADGTWRVAQEHNIDPTDGTWSIISHITEPSGMADGPVDPLSET